MLISLLTISYMKYTSMDKYMPLKKITNKEYKRRYKP